MEETEKIWMNGELVDWADAKVHVGVHGLHYGTGVFEGIRCYDTPKGPGRLPARRPHAAAARLRAAALHGDPVHGRGAARARRTTSSRANGLPACYIRPIAFYGYGQLGVSTQGNPVETVIMSWPWGAYLGESALENGITALHLVLEARRTEHDPARLEGERGLPQLDARDDRGAARRLRRGDPADRRRLRRGRPGREHLRRQERRDPDAAAVDLDPARDHARHGDHDRAGPRLRRRGDAADPLRPLPRRRGVHDRHRRRGDAGARGRRPRDRRRARSRARSRGTTSTPSTGAATAGRTGSTSSSVAASA